MSKFTFKNDALDILQFTGVVKKSLISLFLHLRVKHWSCLCDQPPECPPDPGAHIRDGHVLTGWQLSLPCSRFLQHGQKTQFLLLPQHNRNKHGASVTWDPQGACTLHYMCHSKRQNLLSWKTVCAIYHPKVQGLISSSWSVYRDASVNIASDSTLSP